MERQKKRALVAALQPLQTQTPTQQRAGGYYEPLRESAGPPRKHGARLQPLQPLAKPAARRAVALTPSAERSPAEPEQQGVLAFFLAVLRPDTLWLCAAALASMGTAWAKPFAMKQNNSGSYLIV